MDTGRLIETGHRLAQVRRFAEAEQCFLHAIQVDPGSAIAHSNLGWTRQMQDDPEAALTAYDRALALDPTLRLARRNLAVLLVELGRIEESIPLWQAELAAGADGLSWMQSLVNSAMNADDLTRAGQYAEIITRLRWWVTSDPALQAERFPISIPKLRHDIGQLRYLSEQGIVENVAAQIEEYERLVTLLAPQGEEARLPLDSDEARAIAPFYNRVSHVRATSRLPRALSDRWDPAEVERRYLSTPPGVVVVDDFLTAEALESVRRFCLESTVWSTNRYALGRLGSFFQDGFNCPLLLQIAEELRAAFPQMIGERYCLRQLWGFKSGPTLPADSTTHADFAAVNVNFWITPDDANLDPDRGGLIVYDVDAPMHWDFDTYNGRTDVIRPYLERQHSRSISIPHRQNRAVVFNSDLFHGTDAVTFKPGYENLRVNITMLYGFREEEVHHRHLARSEEFYGARPAWRSAALARARRAR